MFKIISLISLLLISSSTFAASEYHPDTFKLKTYRTYYHFELESSQKHQFEIWYETIDQNNGTEWHVINVGVVDESEAAALTKNQYLSTHKIFAGWPKPPAQIDPIPTNLLNTVDAIKQSVEANEPTLSFNDIKVVYFGEFARVELTELIPIKEHDGLAKFRLGINSTHNYFVDLNNNVLKPFGGMGSGLGILDIGSYRSNPNLKANWLDFVLPKEIEGSSLLSLASPYRNIYAKRSHKDAKEKLDKFVIESTRMASLGQPVGVSLGSLFLKQGPSLLPPRFIQHLSFEIDVYARAANFQDQKHFRVALVPTVKKGEMKAVAKVAELDLEFEFTADIFATSPSGNVLIKDKTSVDVTLDLEIDSSQLKYYEENNNVSIVTLPLKTRPKTTLPARGKFTGIDVYVSSESYPLYLTGEVNK